MEYTGEELRRCLAHYQELTEEELCQIFWKSSWYPLSVLFGKPDSNRDMTRSHFALSCVVDNGNIYTGVIEITKDNIVEYHSVYNDYL